MSQGFIRRERPTEFENEQSSLSCRVTGCNNRATVDGGGGFVCFVHMNTESSKANEAIHRHGYILDAINEVLASGDMEWWAGRWKRLHTRFANRPDLQPSEAERNHRRWYEYRLRDTMAFYAGSVSKMPKPREALKPLAKRMRTTIPSEFSNGASA